MGNGNPVVSVVAPVVVVAVAASGFGLGAGALSDFWVTRTPRRAAKK